MEEVSLGPNGGMIYCFEFLLENLDWLTEELDSLTHEYLVIFDMPGQIELYTHVPVLPNLVRYLTEPGALDMRLCATYLIDSTYIVDTSKFLAGALSALSCMVMVGLPHLNILSKMDLMKGQMKKRAIDEFLVPTTTLLKVDPSEDEDEEMGEAVRGAKSGGTDPVESKQVMRGKSFKKLNKRVAQMLEDQGMVNFLKLDVTDEDSVAGVLSYIDDLIQFQESQEPKEPKDEIEYEFGE